MSAMPKEMLFISTSTGLGAAGMYGGGEHFALELLGELKQRGWSVTLICPPNAPLLSESSLEHALKKRVPLDLSAKISRPLHFLSVLFQWLRFVRRARPSLIYGNGFETLKWIALAKKVVKFKAVCHLHESTYDYYYARRTRRLAVSVDRFFAISETVRGEFHRGAGVALDRIALVPNGVPPSSCPGKQTRAIRAEFGFPETAPLIVMVARTDPLKGHETLLRAVPTVLSSHPDARFLLVGIQRGSELEKELYEKWTRLIEQSGIQQAVKLEPYRADARRLMSGADLVIVPSLSEGFGRTAIEAMAEETAVIASEVGGLAEIITSEVNGVLFPAQDSASLAAAINRLLGTPELRRHLATAGRKSAEERYSTQTMVTRIERELFQMTTGERES
jgi:glycosyltransferase involved in cell wall biosynthesis